MMKLFRYILYAICLWTGSASSGYAQATAGRNYVGQTTVKAPNITTPAQVDALPVGSKRQTLRYFDGLGRPIQTIVSQGSAEKKDIITPVEFDNYGREIKKFLPYVDITGTTYGSFRSSAYADQTTFYNPGSTTIPDIPRDAKPFEQTFIEFSPMGRVLEKGAAGQSWQPGGTHTIKPVFSLNTTAEDVKKWSIAYTAGAVPVSSAYGAGDLSKSITIDEHGKQVVEYRDREDKVILKKVQLLESPAVNHTGWLCTYYVYDDFNNLRFVIPPKAVEAITSNWSFTGRTDVVNELCFIYEYDERGRMITKKIPGAALMEMVYDVRDRLVFTRDGNLSATGQPGGPKWLVTFYDGLNRNVMTAFYNSNATRQSLQTSMNTATANTTDLGYTFPATGDLVVANHDGRPVYEAANSITFEDGFDTGTGADILAQINATQGTTTVTVTNPLPGIPAASLTPLTYTFYDDYSFTGAAAALTTDLGKPQPGSNTNPDAASTYSRFTQGLVTGNKLRVLGTDQWLTTTTYYDDKGRVIQTIAENISGGKDITSNLYDYSGKLLSTFLRHRNLRSGTTPETRVLTMMSYDHSDRVLAITKDINESGIYKEVVANAYNTLGQLTTKTLGAGLETLKYDYNIRGWLQGMNRDYLKDASTNYFGFELAYDQTGSVITGATYTKAQYNGNIGGTIWRSKSDGARRKYDFGYDNASRLLKAGFTQSSSSGWNNSAGVDFSMKVGDGTDPLSAYDANGNIKGMTQQGLKTGGSATIDQLTYTYGTNSNKLGGVVDAIVDPTSTLGDFKELNGQSAADYTYDVNGNLKTDNNKRITAISYNHLNLPENITITNKGTIQYLYDATGNKLQKKVTDNTGSPTKITTTDYIGGFVYENDVLRFTAHEEGRIRTVFQTGQPVSYVYDYFIKDHLGNVRMVLTDQQDATLYVATMETESASKENALFSNIDNTRSNKPVGYPDDGTTSRNEFVARLNAQGEGKKIGPSLVLRVMAGDTVKIGAKAFYKSQGPQERNKPLPVDDMLASLVQAFDGNAAGGNEHATRTREATSPFANNFTSSDYQRLQQKDPDQFKQDKPKAYLNFVLFDDQFNLVEDNSGVRQVQGEPDQLQTLAKDNMSIQKNGFLYVYTSNESPQDVFFDNVTVMQIAGRILEETHYYPFGLTMAGISSNALRGTDYPENRKKYNGIEFTDDLDLDTYDAFYRTLDPQIGRWYQVDPKIDDFYSWTPYNSNFNNPIKYSDPKGDCPTCPPHAWEMDAFNQRKVGEGLMESAKGTITGIYNTVTHPIETVKGIGNAIAHPFETGKALYNSVVTDFKTDPAKASAKLVGDVIQLFIGSAIGKAVKETKEVSHVGDLTKKEIKQIQSVVNEAERPLEVVGSAAAGERRGVGKKLPLGKGPGTKSDIDYVAPPSSLPYFGGLQNKLPSLDPKTGIIPGMGNPYMGPIIRFEPGVKPTVFQKK